MLGHLSDCAGVGVIHVEPCKAVEDLLVTAGRGVVAQALHRRFVVRGRT